jgi:hypothetical protein
MKLPTNINSRRNLNTLKAWRFKHPNSKRTLVVFKFVDLPERSSPYRTPVIIYKKGETVTVTRWSANPKAMCAAGINVASRDWCRDMRGQCQRIIRLSVRVCDIVCIPNHSDSKFRVKRAKVLS